MGSARLGLGDVLAAAGAPEAIAASYFAEADDVLAAAVERRWGEYAARGGAARRTYG